MINRLAFHASLAHIDDLRRQAQEARLAGRRDERVSRRANRLHRIGSSYRLPTGRWIHGTR